VIKILLKSTLKAKIFAQSSILLNIMLANLSDWIDSICID